MSVPIITAPIEWVCPNCDQREVTVEAQPHTRFHTCPGMGFLTAPYVPAGTRCKVVAHEREDYIGGELVTLSGEGRPVMAIETVRDEGTDVVVFAPCAQARGVG